MCRPRWLAGGVITAAGRKERVTASDCGCHEEPGASLVRTSAAPGGLSGVCAAEVWGCSPASAEKGGEASLL